MSKKPFRILIVDDEYQIGVSMKFIIKGLGYDVHAVQSVKETFNALNDVDFHLIIVDLIMNDGNGEELIIKIAEKFPSIKFIIHTGMTSYTPPDDLKKLGISKDHVLIKPYTDLSELENIIEMVLNQ